jgi:release factor glutamine methyltransferase
MSMKELHASNIRELLRLAERELQNAQVPNAANNAAWMLCELLGWKMIDVYAHHRARLSDELLDLYWDMIERRAGREPLQYIVGSTEFMSLPFEARPGVFIPRPETETLVENADRMLREFPLHQPLCALDLCCGSGIIGVSLAHRIGNLEVTAVDVSGEAVELTAHNARQNDVDARVRVVQSDAFRYLENWPEPVTAILCNPPYIESDDLARLPREVREHEPLLALDGGADGLDFYRRVTPLLRPRLAPNGFVMFEIGDTQADAVMEFLRGAGFAKVFVMPDLSGRDRVVTARQESPRG